MKKISLLLVSVLDVTGDTSWTPSKLSNSSFKTQVICDKQGGGANPTCNLDWLSTTVNYTQFDFSVSTNPTSTTINAGDSAQTNVTVTHLSGVSQPVSLSSIGCPPASTCSFDPSSGTPTYTSTFTVATSTNTTPGTYVVNTTGTGDGRTRSSTFTVTVN